MARKNVSEKTLELNITSEMLTSVRQVQGCERALWIGLTQSQESRLGFDEMLTNAGPAQYLYLQFKSPHAALGRDGQLRFSLDTEQHNVLLRLAHEKPNAVFYVLPQLNTLQLLANAAPELLHCTWFLPVQGVGQLALPPKSHRVDSRGAETVVHSDEVRLVARTWQDIAATVKSSGPSGQGSLLLDAAEVAGWLATGVSTSRRLAPGRRLNPYVRRGTLLQIPAPVSASAGED